MINRVVLVGRMVKDVDLRYTGSGKAVGNVTLACERPFKTNGEKETDFPNCTIWGKAAENLATYMKKGSMIGIDGRLQTRSFDNSEGKRQFVTEVVADSVQFLESKGDNQQNNQQSNGQQNQQPQTEGDPIDISDDDLPF